MQTYIRRKSFKPRFNADGSAVCVMYPYEEKASAIEFEDTHTDPSYYQSTSEQVATFMQAGKVLADTRKAVFDFDDGKDDGSAVPPERIYTELPDVSQALNDEVDRLKKTASEKKKSEKAAKEHAEILDAVHSATSATLVTESDNSSD